METSESLNELFEALSLAQGESMAALKDTKGQVGTQITKYADLASCWEACRTPLAKHNLAVIQIPSAEGSKVTVRTTLGHKSGQWMNGSLTVTSSDPSPRGIGSAITYARRYSLCSMVGIAPEDDDGEAASRGTKEAAAKVAEAKIKRAKENGGGVNMPIGDDLGVSMKDYVPPSELEQQLEASVKAVNGSKSKSTTKNFTMLESFKNIKDEIGEPDYYRILGSHGYEKSNQITDAELGRNIWLEMAQCVAEKGSPTNIEAVRKIRELI